SITYGGAGSITADTFATGPNLLQVFAGDFDGDRIDDAAIVTTVAIGQTPFSFVSILYGTIQGTPEPPVPVARMTSQQIDVGILPSDELDDTADLVGSVGT